MRLGTETRKFAEQRSYSITRWAHFQYVVPPLASNTVIVLNSRTVDRHSSRSMQPIGNPCVERKVMPFPSLFAANKHPCYESIKMCYRREKARSNAGASVCERERWNGLLQRIEIFGEKRIERKMDSLNMGMSIPHLSFSFLLLMQIEL